MQPTSTQISIILIGGTAIMLLVAFFILLFVVLYERKKQRYRFTIQELELSNQKKLLEAVINAQEKEKQYFAEELHDSIGQLLSAINLNLNTLKRNISMMPDADPETGRMISLTQEITKTSIQEVRNISQKLMPVILNDFGLLAALTDMCAKINESGVIQIKLEYYIEQVRFAKDVEKALFRISQELVNNTIKHAGAKNIIIAMTYDNGTVVYTYTDDGTGFKDDKGGKTGVGMKSIESRVNYINGNLTISSQKNIGIKIQIKLPKL